MSNTDKLQEAYQAFAEGDLDGTFKHTADDAVYHGVAKGLPYGDDYMGIDAIRTEWLPAIGETLSDLKLDPAKFIEDGDWVVVAGNLTATVNGSTVSSSVAHVWRFDGAKVAEAWFYGDGAQVAKALG